MKNVSTRAVFVKFPRGVRVLGLTSGPGACHGWIRVLGGRSLAVLEFASARVDGEEGEVKIDPPEPVYEYQ